MKDEETQEKRVANAMANAFAAASKLTGGDRALAGHIVLGARLTVIERQLAALHVPPDHVGRAHELFTQEMLVEFWEDVLEVIKS